MNFKNIISLLYLAGLLGLFLVGKLNLQVSDNHQAVKAAQQKCKELSAVMDKVASSSADAYVQLDENPNDLTSSKAISAISDLYVLVVIAENNDCAEANKHRQYLNQIKADNPEYFALIRRQGESILSIR
jgi:hypothetical protein